MTKPRSALLLALAVVSSAGAASAQSIEITSDLAGTQREGEVLPGTNPTLYILARPSDAEPEIGGAEFWVDGLPAAWSAIANPSPSSIAALGNPFATVPPLRAQIAFGPCVRPDENGVILLYTVSLAPTTFVNDLCLTVQVAVPPSNSSFTTPILNISCDPPEDALMAAIGTRFIANPVTRQCTVGVERSTWGGVKSLYTE